MLRWTAVWLAPLFLMTPNVMSAPLVAPETVKLQKDLTEVFTLKNGMKVVYRHIKNSEIVGLTLTYPFGLRDIKPSRKAYASVLLSLMGKAAVGFPKKTIYTLQEKYSGGVGCSHGIEVSHCSLGTVNEYWDKLLPVMVAVTQNPLYQEEDLKLLRDSRIASIESKTQEPSSYVNQVVNRNYYPDNHPYKLTFEDEVKQLKKINTKTLLKLHKVLKHARGQFFTYVGSMPLAKVKKDLEAAFGGIVLKDVERKPVPQPKFIEAQSFAIDDRPIPTAYMSIKFNGPGRTEKDYLGTLLMLRILSEELGLEIRTKRSLSYAVHSFMIGNSIGIGLISATTSKPKETLAAIDEIVGRMKTKKYSEEELKRYKNVYTTTYFLTLEEHSALSSALSSNYYYYNSLDAFYERPMRLGAINSATIQQMARKYLVNFRVGVIFKKENFKDMWAKTFIGHHKAGSEHSN